jgi:hypothetical protein
MKTWIWILVIVGLLIVVAGAVLIARQRRTASLRQQFGPEYDRTVENAEGRRAAEQQLRQREKEHASLPLRPLPEAARARYLEEWREIQARFLDEPATAVDAADGLLNRVMSARGYPVDDFEAQSDLVSVDHPDVVENYRAAHRVHDENRAKRASTEDLREALLRYRTLFEELLRAENPGGGTGADADDNAQSNQATGRGM